MADNDYAIICSRAGDCNLISNHCPNKRLAVQAGSYRGIYPERLAKIFDKVITFEADENNFKQWLTPSQNIERHLAILGDKEGFGGIQRIPHHPAQSYVSETGKIPIMTIDGLNLDVCDLIFLDVEGYELKALLGAEQTIKRHHPIISVEQKRLINKRGFGNHDDMMLFLGSNGYKRICRYNLDVVYG